MLRWMETTPPKRFCPTSAGVYQRKDMFLRRKLFPSFYIGKQPGSHQICPFTNDGKSTYSSDFHKVIPDMILQLS